MSELQPARETAPFRVAIIQDVPDTAKQQAQLLEREAARRGLTLEVQRIELRKPASRISSELLDPGGVDWIVLDLLISPIDDHNPLQSAGLNLLRKLHGNGDLHGYQARSPRNAEGVRCVAVYSASLAGFGNKEQEIRDALSGLGVAERHRYIPGEMRKVAEAICDELESTGAEGW